MKRCVEPISHLLPVLVFALCVAAAAQDDTSGQGQTAPPPAATGPADQNLENPPVTGLDRPQSEPAFGGRSYFVPGLQASEGLNSNASGAASRSTVRSVSRILGSADLQKLWRKYQVGLDYVGGVAGYAGVPNAGHFYQMHTLAADQRIPWRTGQLAIRDSFDYLPEGSFGLGSFGGAGSLGTSLGMSGTGLGGGITGGIGSGIFSGGQLGSVGLNSRIENFGIVDVTQEFSARTSITLAGGYDYAKFLNSKTFIDSEATIGQVGYNYILNRKDQIGAFYAFQELHFPVAGSGTVESHVWNGLYAHRISGKLNLVFGGGPQLVQVRTPPFTFLLLGIIPITIPGSTTRTVSGSGTATVAYTPSARSSLNLSFLHYITTGSGFLAGANTTAARMSLTHTFGRKWNGSSDFGYSYNTRLQSVVSGAGSNSKNYQYWYAGGALRRQLSEHFDVFGNYQFEAFGTTCLAGSPICGAHQHVGNVGIEWHPKPIRLD